MEFIDMEIRHLPGFSRIMKMVLKSQIQHLVSQLAQEAQEESLVVTACLEDGTFSSVGSESGLDFLEDNAELKASFLGFCMKKKHKPMLAKGQDQELGSEKTGSSVCLPVLDKGYTPANKVSPHPVTLCKILNSRPDLIPLQQRKWSYHGQLNSPGKSKLSFRQRVKPYKVKRPQIIQTNSDRYLNSKCAVNSYDNEDKSKDYIEDKDIALNAPGPEKGNCDQFIKVEQFEECDTELDTETTVESTARASYQSSAPLLKNASASATNPEFKPESVSVSSSDSYCFSSETGWALKNPTKNHCTSNTISLPLSETVQSELSPSLQKSSGSVNVSVKIETPSYMYDQEESTGGGGVQDHVGVKNDKIQNSTQDSQSCKRTEPKCTGNGECLFTKEKNFCEAEFFEQTDEDTLERWKVISENQDENRQDESAQMNASVDTNDQMSQNKTTNASKQPTFIALNDFDKDKFLNVQRNPNTVRKTESAVKQFERWLSSAPRHIGAKVTELPVAELDDYIGSFLLSIRKADGSEYEPDTLTSYHRGIDRYLREKQYPYSMVHDPEFSTSRAVLASKRKQLKMSGKGCRPNATQPLTSDQQPVLKAKKCIGLETPEQLLSKLLLNNTAVFGIRGGTENHNLRLGDISLKTDLNGIEFLELNERYAKQKSGATNLSNVHAFRLKLYAQESPEDCPVYAYKEYIRRRPIDSCNQDSPFYLAINHNRRPFSQVWFKNQPLGGNRLRALMKKMSETAYCEVRKNCLNRQMEC